MNFWKRLFTRRRSPNAVIREVESSRSLGQERLARIAFLTQQSLRPWVNHSDPDDVEYLNRDRLEAQTKLIKLVESENDQAILFDIALSNPVERARRAAFKLINDQSLVFRIALKTKFRDVGGLAVNTLTNPVELAKVAIEAVTGDNRASAVRKVEDQALLARIAATDKDIAVRYAVIDRLSDQALLTQFATQSDDPFTRLFATARLKDQAILAKIATEDEDKDVRLKAIEGLKDLGTIAKIAENKLENTKVRCASMRRLVDQSLVAKIALDSANDDGIDGVLSVAVDCLNDQIVLHRLVMQRKLGFICFQSLERLTDQELLANIATEHDEFQVRVKAVEKLTNQSLLAKLVADCRRIESHMRRYQGIELNQAIRLDNLIRCSAIERISDRQILDGLVFKGDIFDAECVTSATKRREVVK